MGRAAVTDVVIGGGKVLATVLAAPIARTRYNRWGATDQELASPMPGDELVAAPKLGYTRAITIEAPPERVWPWLVQIGQGRGGLYSFDGLENLVGCDIHSSEEILPECQELHPGDLIRLGRPGYPCFRVHSVSPPNTLVLVAADPKPPHDAATDDSPAGIATWQWELRPAPDGRSTRLLVRQRLAYPRSMRLMWHLVEPIAYVMEREMLHGIRDRARRG
ncbi:MAG: SRPBCC family protein [Candidatus Nanopelagicales bacterium]